MVYSTHILQLQRPSTAASGLPFQRVASYAVVLYAGGYEGRATNPFTALPAPRSEFTPELMALIYWQKIRNCYQ